MHEHVFIISPEMKDNVPEEWGDDDERLDDAVRRLNELKAAGIDAILDPTALGLGRYIPRIAKLAGRIDLQIIVATGPVHVQRAAPLLAGAGAGQRARRQRPDGRPVRQGHHRGHRRHRHQGRRHQVRHRPPRRDARRRAGAAGVRPDPPGHRHARSPPTPYAGDRARPRAAGDLQGGGRRPDPGRHRPQRRHQRPRLPRGADRQRQRSSAWTASASTAILPTDERVKVIAELCERGYADRMVLSHDASCYLDWIPGEIPPSTMPHWHYLHISKDVLPMLREAGVTEAQIDTMLDRHPAPLPGEPGRLLTSRTYSGSLPCLRETMLSRLVGEDVERAGDLAAGVGGVDRRRR